MIFTRKTKYKPKEGDERIITKFAWFPKLIASFGTYKTYVWLEFYKVHQHYTDYLGPHAFFTKKWWQTTKVSIRKKR